ncbi:DUF4278 domain-containing protein [Parvibaculum sp.]|uniref:DUF4278 domain-containing protein n=1 Tax=Parvibaculum sp. TaxID=2024848 RepID=UPI001D416F52|nr:DUF4278 domain-containing protein [Parvibaculum sp.]MBX3489650.1 DUF4278 domain-containing protein [Parvibaculum sp.]MCW5726392.1 DUF4278 domain-containing protein [Parvibaculum sp.]
MTDLTYRGAAHHGEKAAGATGSATLRYRGASYRATPHDKPKASHAGLRYRGIPQHD